MADPTKAARGGRVCQTPPGIGVGDGRSRSPFPRDHNGRRRPEDPRRRRASGRLPQGDPADPPAPLRRVPCRAESEGEARDRHARGDPQGRRVGAGGDRGEGGGEPARRARRGDGPGSRDAGVEPAEALGRGGRRAPGVDRPGDVLGARPHDQPAGQDGPARTATPEPARGRAWLGPDESDRPPPATLLPEEWDQARPGRLRPRLRPACDARPRRAPAHARGAGRTGGGRAVRQA